MATISINGGKVRTAPWTKWAVLAALLFLPMLLIANNLLYGVTYDDDVKLDDDYIAEYDADDPRLIEHIRKYYIEPPIDASIPFNLNNPNQLDYSHKRQSAAVDKVLKQRENGFYVEAGAYDGETYSNSLFFEKTRRWKGLLVEPDFANLKRLRAKNRKAWIARSCLDGGDRAKRMTMLGAMDIGGLTTHFSLARKIITRIWRPTKETEVWCFPLPSILKAINQTKVDYMIIDVEGSEMNVLRQLAKSKIEVDVYQIEYMIFQGGYWDRDESQVRYKAMKSFFESNLPNYKEYIRIFLDVIYVKKGILN